MITGSLCTGYGGLELGLGMVVKTELAFVSEIDPGACKVLAARFPAVPNLGDLREVNWPSAGADILTAGFPCQDVSHAGERKGLREGTRTGVWYQIARAIGALRPQLVILENVRGLLSAGADSDVEPCPWCLGEAGSEYPLRALGAVLADLCDLGLDAEWITVPASAAGACHHRERVFIAAYPGRGGVRGGGIVGHLRGEEARQSGEGDQRERGRDSAGDSGPAAADTAGSSWQQRGVAAAVEAAGRGTCPDPGRRDGASFGIYEPAIRRWEEVTGRPAPRPVVDIRGRGRLNPAFAEWMMGLPSGWVTGVPGISRRRQLKILGNGVVPQQAALAVRMLDVLPS